MSEISVPQETPPPASKPEEPETPEARRQRILLKNEEIRERNLRIEREKKAICQKQRSTKPEVHIVDLENFKNRYNWTPEHQEYAVEVLVGPWDLRQQYQQEKKRREPGVKATTRTGMLAAYNFFGWPRLGDTNVESNWDQERRSNLPMAVDPNDEYIHRICIHSTPVLGYLTGLIRDEINQDLPRTFMRPFMTLISFQPAMKHWLTVLEEKWAAAEANSDLATADQPTAPKEDTEGKAAQKNEEISMDGQSVQRPVAVVGHASSGEASIDILTPQEESPAIVKGVQEIDANSGCPATADDDTASVYTTSAESVIFDNDENKILVEGTMDTAEALRDMRCYVEYIDEKIMPNYNLLRGDSAEKVTFDDLWCLFHPGDIIYRQKTDLGDKSRSTHELWRVYEVVLPDMSDATSYEFHFGRRNGPKSPSTVSYGERLNLTCYSIDYDGSSYGAIHKTFAMHYFPGRKAIRSLEVYPLRFVKNHDAILAASRLTGQKYHGALAQRHQSYHNWTLTTEPGTFPEFIESHVIVDFEETFRKAPEWRPTFHYSQRIMAGNESENEFGWCDDPWRIFYHTGERGAAEFCFSQAEIVTLETPINKWQRQEYIDGDDFLKTQTVEDTYSTFDGPPTTNITGDDFALLPRRAYAYTLRERKFVSIDINHLKPIVGENNVLQRLKISREYKDILRGLVSSHFQKKELERLYLSQSMQGISQDLISGKGKGLVILLHGAPGVGKTATAESVAIENKRPLFSITCGDLGLSPSEVETSLTDIFRLAHKWDCVLLLDEADIFLSQRSRSDLKRNALVSVFLRVLEYYNGLLFLTTNRVGTIDEAFKSRIHMSLYYPPLGQVQTTEIFRLNIGKLREIERQRSALTKQPELVINEEDILLFAQHHFQENFASGACWNGRQIRNAFQVASGLAHYEFQRDREQALREQRDPPSAPQLNRILFEKVQHATNDFDRYIQQTKGWSDADYAHKLGERSDHVKATHFPSASAPHPQSGFHADQPAQATGGPQYTRSPSPAGLFSGNIPVGNFASQSEQNSTPPYGYAPSPQPNHRPVQGQFGGSPACNSQVTPTTPGRYNFQASSHGAQGQMMQDGARQGFLSPPAQSPAAFRSLDVYEPQVQRPYEIPIIGGRSNMTTGSSGTRHSEMSGQWNEGGANVAGSMGSQMRYGPGQSAAEEDLYN